MFLVIIVQPRSQFFACKHALALCGLAASLCLSAMAGSNAEPEKSPAANSSAAAAPIQTIHFSVSQYEVEGNTLLPERILNDIVSKHTGTNVTFDDVGSAV